MTYNLTYEDVIQLIKQGFNLSSEGYNGEYSNYTDDELWNDFRRVADEYLVEKGLPIV